MAVNDIYEVIAQELIFGQKIENVFHYSVTVDPLDASSSDQIIGLVESSILETVTLHVTSDFTWTTVKAKNLNSLVDFDELPFEVPGTIAPPTAPPEIGFMYELKRGILIPHNGRKNFTGVPLAYIVNGTINPLLVAGLADVAGGMGGVLSGSGISYAPVIYRKPDTLHPLGTAFITAGAIFRRLSTQNSRKIGVGQ